MRLADVMTSEDFHGSIDNSSTPPPRSMTDETSRRMCFAMTFGCLYVVGGEHSRCFVDIHAVICSGYDNIFVTFNFYLH